MSNRNKKNVQRTDTFDIFLFLLPWCSVGGFKLSSVIINCVQVEAGSCWPGGQSVASHHISVYWLWLRDILLNTATLDHRWQVAVKVSWLVVCGRVTLLNVEENRAVSTAVVRWCFTAAHVTDMHVRSVTDIKCADKAICEVKNASLQPRITRLCMQVVAG